MPITIFIKSIIKRRPPFPFATIVGVDGGGMAMNVRAGGDKLFEPPGRQMRTRLSAGRAVEIGLDIRKVANKYKA